MDYGQLEQTDGQARLRFERQLSHPPEKVWAALTEPAERNTWFPTQIIGEWTVGAPLRFEFTDHDLPGFDGEVLACEPPSVLEFTWGQDTLRFEIVPAEQGCTLLLSDTLEELGKAARDGAGWHACFDVLESSLAGEELPRDRWSAVAPAYRERFGPEASTIGPPKGMVASES